MKIVTYTPDSFPCTELWLDKKTVSQFFSSENCAKSYHFYFDENQFCLFIGQWFGACHPEFIIPILQHILGIDLTKQANPSYPVSKISCPAVKNRYHQFSSGFFITLSDVNAFNHLCRIIQEKQMPTIAFIDANKVGIVSTNEEKAELDEAIRKRPLIQLEKGRIFYPKTPLVIEQKISIFHFDIEAPMPIDIDGNQDSLPPERASTMP